MTLSFRKTYRYLFILFFLLILTISSTECYGRAFACAARPFNTTEFLETIDDHVLSLRENNIAKAYYKYTSKEFQEETSLQEFTSLVHRQPPLKDNFSIELTGIEFFEGVGQYRGILSSTEGKKIMIEYELVKCDGSWKILGFRLMSYVYDQNKQTSRKGSLTASS